MQLQHPECTSATSQASPALNSRRKGWQIIVWGEPACSPLQCDRHCKNTTSPMLQLLALCPALVSWSHGWVGVLCFFSDYYLDSYKYVHPFLQTDTQHVALLTGAAAETPAFSVWALLVG